VKLLSNTVDAECLVTGDIRCLQPDETIKEVTCEANEKCHVSRRFTTDIDQFGLETLELELLRGCVSFEYDKTTKIITEVMATKTRYCSSNEIKNCSARNQTVLCYERPDRNGNVGTCVDTGQENLGCQTCVSRSYTENNKISTKTNPSCSENDPTRQTLQKNSSCPSGVCQCQLHTEHILQTFNDGNIIIERGAFSRGAATLTNSVDRATNQTTIFCDDRSTCDQITFDSLPCELEVPTTTTVELTTTVAAPLTTLSPTMSTVNEQTATTEITTTSKSSISTGQSTEPTSRSYPSMTTTTTRIVPSSTTAFSSTSGSTLTDTPVSNDTKALTNAVISLSVICFLLILMMVLLGLHHKRITKKLRNQRLQHRTYMLSRVQSDYSNRGYG